MLENYKTKKNLTVTDCVGGRGCANFGANGSADLDSIGSAKMGSIGATNFNKMCGIVESFHGPSPSAEHVSYTYWSKLDA